MWCSDQLVGVYKLAAVAVTRQLLTLRIDGTWVFHDYRDLGGRWLAVNKGRYAVEPEGLRLQPDFIGKSRWDLALFSTPFHIARVADEVLLVHESRLAQFRDALTARDMADRLFYFEAGWNVFRKQPLPRLVICQDAGGFEGNLTIGRRYLVREESQHYLRIVTDSNRLRWFPREYFIKPRD